MPVRIYDISKKLGLDNKQVLAKAKELGITAARVASSPIDKITAEYLEEQLRLSQPPAVQAPETPVPVPVLQSVPTAVQPRPQLAKAPGIVLQTSDPEVQGLLERILSGEVPFVVEVLREGGLPPLKAKMVPEAPLRPPETRPRPEIVPRADLDERTKDLFRAAYYSARHVSKDEWVNMAEYGNALKRQDPTFQPQDFGERSLGGLVRRMVDDFDLKSDGTTSPVYYIRLKPHAGVTPPPTKPATPSPQHAQPKRHATGKVHNLKLGFGFIAPDDGSENLFFHATEVTGCTIFDLRPGDPVEYESGVNERGPCAWKVKRLGTSGNPEIQAD
jgi:cold shock CspA family protein